MKIIKKILIWFIIFLFPYLAFADNYILYYWNGCSHCAKVEKYINQNSINNITQKEIYFDSTNRKEFLLITEELWVKQKDVWVPFFYIVKDNWEKEYLIGDMSIISFLSNIKKGEIINTEISNTNNLDKNKKDYNPWKFFLILLPAALSDSINPCAFAVILILLWSVLARFGSRKKVILTWIMFSSAIFISYLFMGLGLYNFLWNLNTTFYFKLWVWILWIVIWLANLKDFFWYWKGFIMEVPIAWRPRMKKFLKKVTSPFGWFIIWLIVSLFLLPCTSWPYLTVLGYLSTEDSILKTWGYIYLIVYNIIFILPMIIITFLISFWYVSIWTIMEFKEDKKEMIHLIVWILMLILWIYVIGDSLY